MNYGRILLAIGIMALVSYLPRVLPLAIFRKKINNTFIKSVLNYMPYGILAAMIIPEVFYSTGNMISASVGFIVAVGLSYKKLGLLPVSVISTLFVFITELIIKAVA